MKFDKLFFNHADAVKHKCPNKAIILEFIRWSIHYKESSENEESMAYYHRDGYWWMQDSIKAWHERMPWLSERTIKRKLSDLVESGSLISKTIVDKYGGHCANMYRLPIDDSSEKITLPHDNLGGGGVTNCHNPLVTKRHPPSDKMEPTSLSNNLSNNPEPNIDTVKTKNGNTHTENPPSVPSANATGTRSISRKTNPSQKAKKPLYTQDDLDLGQQWVELHKTNSKAKILPSGTTPEKYAEHIATVKKRAGIDHVTMVNLFKFLQRDDFWRPNALSPAGLLKKSAKNDLRKIDNIFNAIERESNVGRAKPKMEWEKQQAEINASWKPNPPRRFTPEEEERMDREAEEMAAEAQAQRDAHRNRWKSSF